MKPSVLFPLVVFVLIDTNETNIRVDDKVTGIYLYCHYEGGHLKSHVNTT
jgi:hypothetical protein